MKMAAYTYIPVKHHMINRYLVRVIEEQQKVEEKNNVLYQKTIKIVKFNDLEVTMETTRKLA